MILPSRVRLINRNAMIPPDANGKFILQTAAVAFVVKEFSAGIQAKLFSNEIDAIDSDNVPSTVIMCVSSS
jgi:hypothetical protein